MVPPPGLPPTAICSGSPPPGRSTRTDATPMPIPRHRDCGPPVTTPPRTGAIDRDVRHADADPEARRLRAAGDDAAPGDGVALPGDAAVADDERDESLRRPGGADCGDGLGPDEARVLLAAPPEPSLDR